MKEIEEKRKSSDCLLGKIRELAIPGIKESAIANLKLVFKSKKTIEKYKKIIEDDDGIQKIIEMGLASEKISNMDLTLFSAGLIMRRQMGLLEDLLEVDAVDADVETGDTWFPYDCVHVSTYNSQGFGATKYTQCAAEVMVDHIRHHGIEAVTAHYPGVYKPSPYPGVASYSAGECFVVAAKVAGQIDIEILKRKPCPNSRETIKSILQRGCNLRVFDPFLPHGTEEALGLDHFGNDIPVKGQQ